MKTALCALLLLTSPAFADQSAPLLDLATVAKGVWIGTSQQKEQPPLLHVVLLPREYTASGLLEVDIELPDGQSPSDLVYSFNGEPFGEYVYRYGDHFTVYLPPLEANRLQQFSIGIPDAQLAFSRASAVLASEHGETPTHWQGFMLRELEP